LEIVGTPWFMSPESIRNSVTTDPRSDIYAVGALAYYLLTGKYVFEHDTLEEIHDKQMSTVPTPPSQLTTNPVSPEMEQVIARCLDKDRELRPQSAMELCALLATSPRAADSTPESRAAWWAEFHRLKQVATPEDASTPSSVPTVRVDLASRMK